MSTKPKLELYEIKNVSRIVFSSLDGGRKYVWEQEREEFNPQIKYLSDVNAEACEARWFIFYLQDCFDPCMYAVNGRSFEDAYEEFTEWQVDQLKVDESDLEDYDPETLSYSSKGIPIDTELLQGFEVRIETIHCS